MKRIILVLVAMSVLFPGYALAQRHGPGPGHGWSGHRPPPPPPPAYHGHRGHHGGGDPEAIAAGIAGLAFGALAAGAMTAQQPATPPPGYYPPQGYYPPPPPPPTYYRNLADCYPREPVPGTCLKGKYGGYVPCWCP